MLNPKVWVIVLCVILAIILIGIICLWAFDPIYGPRFVLDNNVRIYAEGIDFPEFRILLSPISISRMPSAAG